MKSITLMAAAALLSAPAAAQTVSGCGTVAVSKAEAKDVKRLRANASCFGRAADVAQGARATRLALLPDPAPSPSPTPTPEPAETTGLRVGMNLDGSGLSYWGGWTPFTDRYRARGEFTAKATDWSNLPASAVTFNPSTGYPAQQTANIMMVQGLFPVDPQSVRPKSRYVITWAGTAKVAISNNAAANVESGDQRFAFDYVGDSTSAMLELSGLTDRDPVRDIRIVRTDEEAAFKAGQILAPAYLDKLKPWSVLRFMDWAHTNGSKLAAFDQRPTDRSLWGEEGVPIEVMVDVANAAGADMWYNIPAHADDDFIRRAVTLIRDRLSPTARLHLEYSNEVWNWAFEQTYFAREQGKTLKGVSADAPHLAWLGYRSAQMATIAGDVFRDQPQRLRVVIAPQAYWAGAEPYIFEGARLVGDPAKLFQEYAIAPYFGFCMQDEDEADRAVVLGWARVGADGLTAAFKGLAQCEGLKSKSGTIADVGSTVVYHVKVAASMGMELVAYEGGHHLDGQRYAAGKDRDDFVGLVRRMNDDPRMNQVYDGYLQAFQSAGGKLFTAFNDIGSESQYGSWGALRSPYQATSPRWDALLAAQRSAGK